MCSSDLVNTRNLGGRDTLLPDFAVRYAEDTAESVAENVAYWVANPIDPIEVRKGFLKLAEPQKEVVQELVNSISGRKVHLPHKLNIRCRLLPHTKLMNGIMRKK